MKDERSESPDSDLEAGGRINRVLSYRALTLRVGRALLELAQTGTIRADRERQLREDLENAR